MKEVNYADLKFHPTNMLANEWMILCAGNQDVGYNGMTVSWGHSRYTLGFMEKEEYFTVNLLPQSLKRALAIFGSKSGRDCDKFKEANVTPGFTDCTTYIEESKYVFICKKLYTGDLKEEGFSVPGIVEDCYPNKDFHRFFVGEIVKVLQATDGE